MEKSRKYIYKNKYIYNRLKHDAKPKTIFHNILSPHFCVKRLPFFNGQSTLGFLWTYRTERSLDKVSFLLNQFPLKEQVRYAARMEEVANA
jgi:hypothetical protein